MTDDPSRGWNAVAADFMKARSDAGVDVVERWARQLPSGAAVLDIGCGSGAPVGTALVGAGLQVWGVDASPALVDAFRRRLPGSPVACEPAESSAFFGRRFDGAVAIGLLFLLPAEDQLRLLHRVAEALEPGGRFLFTAPRTACEWTDSLTGRPSRSLGEAAYGEALARAGLRLAANHRDAGGNDYFDAVREADDGSTTSGSV
ncbi:MAG: class I SAM-dependent methyltransferase [Brevundimonas sp.]|uniref:class I SAM-dependent methyltransferase n=1 Tax=Brevundimonas sp. TaxID=1871086 RepID=UPI001807283E|nr:class I SAM-dependent methyltransferase [Brevundimonas sp.]MBA4804160.1 class I SAM-dependent methyltransferase [Brevundimonas sp.]